MHPGYRGKLSELEGAPDLADTTPLLRHGPGLCAMDHYPEATLNATPDGFALRLRGEANPVTPLPPTSLAGRIMAAIDWRFLGGRLGRGANLKRKPLPGLEANRTLQLNTSAKCVSVKQELSLSQHSYANCVHPPANEFSPVVETEPATGSSYIYQQCSTYDRETGARPTSPTGDMNPGAAT